MARVVIPKVVTELVTPMAIRADRALLITLETTLAYSLRRLGMVGVARTRTRRLLHCPHPGIVEWSTSRAFDFETEFIHPNMISQITFEKRFASKLTFRDLE